MNVDQIRVYMVLALMLWAATLVYVMRAILVYIAKQVSNIVL